jgi:hypothetical protein
MFPRFAPSIVGVMIIVCAVFFVGLAQAVPVSISADADHTVSTDVQDRASAGDGSTADPSEDAVAVPLPSAVVLFVSALAGLGLLARRRRTPKAGNTYADLPRQG